MRSVLLPALALAGAVGIAHAQDVRIGATITGEVQPGVYGQVVIGDRPPPALVYQQPVIIEPAPAAQQMAPIYLHVPPEHAHHWREHCHEYRACGRPVYFVRSAEYEPGYERRHHEHEEHEHEEHERHEHHDDRDDRGDH
jgi:hypothetical protein